MGAPNWGAGARGTGRVAQAHNNTLPTMAAHTHRIRCMLLLLLEALGAGLLFIGIIWWTMFAGRHKGELPAQDAHTDQPPQAAPTTRYSDAQPPGPSA